MSAAIARLAILLGPFAFGGGCREAPPPPVSPVRLYVAPGLPGATVAELARGHGIAAPTLVASVDEAEVAWLPDPVAALALGSRAAPGSAPEQPGVPDAFLDAKRRFAPVGAIGHVLVTRADDRGAPDDLRSLGEPAARGQVAMAGFDRGSGPLLLAALALAHGERGAAGWRRNVEANGTAFTAAADEAVARVAEGRSRVALVDSVTAAAALKGGRLRVVFPDQRGKGCVVIPTALVVLPGAGAPARKLAAWLSGPGVDSVLAHRLEGLLPLREFATAPAGIEPIWRLHVFVPTWDRLADHTTRPAPKE